MYIRLDFETKKPIYKQLVEQIIAGIAQGKLLPGDRLPSVRSLAGDLGVNLHTVNKAYQELRQKNYLLIHRQRGAVVHPDGMPPADKEFLSTLEKNLDPLISEAILRNMSEADFIDLCLNIFKKYEPKEGGER